MTHPTVILGPAAPRIRRRLGPLAWAVLEALHEVAVEVDGGKIAPTNTRLLSDGLGIGRDTVARGLRVLRDAGLVSVDVPRSAGGRFDRSSYRLHTPPEAIRTRRERAMATASPVTPSIRERPTNALLRETSPSTARASAVSSVSATSQLALFPGAPDAVR